MLLATATDCSYALKREPRRLHGSKKLLERHMFLTQRIHMVSQMGISGFRLIKLHFGHCALFTHL
jgi:hypothetical protein